MTTPDKWVRLLIDPRFRLGTERIAERCGWLVRPDDNGLLVCLEERYHNTRSRLIEPQRLADASNAETASAYASLATWPPQDEHTGGLSSAIQAEISRHLGSDSIEEWLYGWQLAVLTATDAELPTIAQESFRNTILANFQEASLWAARIDLRFYWRSSLIRVLFGATEAPEILDRTEEEFEGFAAQRELTSGVAYGLDTMIGPALTVAAPSVLGVSSQRAGGEIIILFGEPVPGLRNTPVPELLHLFGPRIPTSNLVPEASAYGTSQEIESFIRWWIERLNDLFAVVLDPARYQSQDGDHDVRAEFGVLLSVARLFQFLGALLAATTRDEFVRRTLLFDILDLLDGLRFSDFRTLLTTRRAKQALKRVGDTGGGVAKPAMTKCLAAVEALERVGDGFYLSERRTADGIRLRRRSDQSWETISLENAIADYLRVLRNSAHSFMESTKDPRDLSLLAAHTGELPEGLPDLALLYVLDLLLKPNHLAVNR